VTNLKSKIVSGGESWGGVCVHSAQRVRQH